MQQIQKHGLQDMDFVLINKEGQKLNVTKNDTYIIKTENGTPIGLIGKGKFTEKTRGYEYCPEGTMEFPSHYLKPNIINNCT